MSTSMPDKDLRKVILHKHVPEYGGIEFQTHIEQKIYLAMDEYFETRCKELLSFMAKHSVDCEVTKEGNEVFLYKGEMISGEQLIENFL